GARRAPRPHSRVAAEGGIQTGDAASGGRCGSVPGMSTVIADTAPPEALPPTKGFMFDVDGTLLLSDRSLGGYELLPGAVEVLTRLRERSIPFVLLTNGSAYPPAEQAGRLRKLGLPVDDAQMLTPSSVAADLVGRKSHSPGLGLGP